MGTYSHIEELDLQLPRLKTPLTESLWAFGFTGDSVDYMSYFLPLRFEKDCEKKLGEEPVNYITGVSIHEGESGKAYDFDKHVAVYFSKLSALLGSPITGSFKLVNEDDVEKMALYVIREDGHIEVSQAVISFPEVTKVL